MKRILQWILLGGLILGLAGCGLSFPAVSQRDIQAGGKDPMSPMEREDHTLQEPEATAQPLTEPQTVCLWAREQLGPEAQETYDRLSDAIAHLQTSEVEVDSSSEEVQLVLTALRIDHPEYFWFNGEASYVTSSIPLMGTQTSCTLSYTMEEDEIRQRLLQVEQYTRECFGSAELAGAETDHDKIIGVYRYIIGHTDYVLSAVDQSFISVMTDRQGTCAGYARTFEYLMHQLDIPCTLALGAGSEGESHGWNVVMCGGQWYHIDVTWGDPVGEDGLPGSSLSYTYCMVTDTEIYRDHTPSGDIPMPVCTATEYNYFRQSGRQMAGWDSAAYTELLAEAALGGENWFSVRFDRQEDFSSAMTALIDHGEILSMFQTCGLQVPETGVTYSRNDEFLEFSVQLPPLAQEG